jgi:hypothetical protein
MRESELANIAAVAESAATTRWREGPKTAKAMSGRRNCVEPGDHRRAGDAGVAENLRNGSSKLASGRQPRPEEPRALIGRRPPSILNDIRRCPLSSSDGRSARANGRAREPPTPLNVCMRSSNGASRPRRYCPRLILQPCYFGRCLLPARSSCARLMDGKRSLRNYLISPLTQPPDQITSKLPEIAHRKFQHNFGRHRETGRLRLRPTDRGKDVTIVSAAAHFLAGGVVDKFVAVSDLPSAAECAVGGREASGDTAHRGSEVGLRVIEFARPSARQHGREVPGAELVLATVPSSGAHTVQNRFLRPPE